MRLVTYVHLDVFQPRKGKQDASNYMNEEQDLVCVEMDDNLERVTKFAAQAREAGWLLVCDVCRRESEPLVALLATPGEPPQIYGFCASCYCELTKTFAGSVV